MKRAYLRTHGKPGLELIEEAFVLLRSSPATVLTTYYLGAVPFVAGFLIFCSNFSRQAEAADQLGEATLAMTALFIWMKLFQARFGRLLLARLRGESPPSWQAMEIGRSVCVQTILQSTGLFLLPAATLIMLPFGWVYAFYQNVSALDDGKTRLKELFDSAARQSALWAGQNHLVLLTLTGFGFFVFLNWITVGFFAPHLLKMFFGVESVFTQSPMALFNTTFFAAVTALTYLSVDPLIKACYVVRCFHGQSLHSGDDLRTEVRKLSRRAPALAIWVFLLLTPVAGAQENVPAPTPVVASEKLDRSITTVLEQRKYQWRSPREKAAKKKEDGIVTKFFKSIFEMLEKVAKDIERVMKKIIDWLFPEKDRPVSSRDISGWMATQQGLLFLILAALAAGLGVFLLRAAQNRRRTAEVESVALAPAPDLEDENTAANDLPEDDWTQMGRRLLEQGDLRRALRAFYLASLAHLATRGLITIARSKSNRDYERELRRRGHSMPELPVLFGENVGIFDRVWYGLHEVSPETVQRFVGNLERMKAAA